MKQAKKDTIKGALIMGGIIIAIMNWPLTIVFGGCFLLWKLFR